MVSKEDKNYAIADVLQKPSQSHLPSIFTFPSNNQDQFSHLYRTSKISTRNDNRLENSSFNMKNKVNMYSPKNSYYKATLSSVGTYGHEPMRNCYDSHIEQENSIISDCDKLHGSYRSDFKIHKNFKALYNNDKLSHNNLKTSYNDIHFNKNSNFKCSDISMKDLNYQERFNSNADPNYNPQEMPNNFLNDIFEVDLDSISWVNSKLWDLDSAHKSDKSSKSISSILEYSNRVVSQLKGEDLLVSSFAIESNDTAKSRDYHYLKQYHNERKSFGFEGSKNLDQKVFIVNLYIDTKDKHMGPLLFEVYSRMNLRLLKIKVQQEFKIAKDLQRWILGSKFATDDEKTLYEYGIYPGCHIFLYVNPQKEIVNCNNKSLKNILQNIKSKNKLNVKSSVTNKVESDQIIFNEKDIGDSIKTANNDSESINSYNEQNNRNFSLETSDKINLHNQPLNDLISDKNEPKDNSPHPFSLLNKDLSDKLSEALSSTQNLENLFENSKIQDDLVRNEFNVFIKDVKSSNDINQKDKKSSFSHNESVESIKELDDVSLDQHPIQQDDKEIKIDSKKHTFDNESAQNFNYMLEIENMDLVKNNEAFACPICFDIIENGNGIILHDCLHNFCQNCLSTAIIHSEGTMIKCPYRDDIYSCESFLQQREIKALVTPDVYEKYLQRSIIAAESLAENSFHCKTADCSGWCLYEENITIFHCPVCKHYNCLNCRAIHEGINCRQYQNKLKEKNDPNAAKTLELLKQMIEDGKALKCPTCDLILMKKWGCDWLKCSICSTEICWITKGPRWGPAGQGDTSAGCRCGVNGIKCHPSCTYCH